MTVALVRLGGVGVYYFYGSVPRFGAAARGSPSALPAPAPPPTVGLAPRLTRRGRAEGGPRAGLSRDVIRLGRRNSKNVSYFAPSLIRFASIIIRFKISKNLPSRSRRARPPARPRRSPLPPSLPSARPRVRSTPLLLRRAAGGRADAARRNGMATRVAIRGDRSGTRSRRAEAPLPAPPRRRRLRWGRGRGRGRGRATDDDRDETGDEERTRRPRSGPRAVGAEGGTGVPLGPGFLRVSLSRSLSRSPLSPSPSPAPRVPCASVPLRALGVSVSLCVSASLRLYTSLSLCLYLLSPSLSSPVPLFLLGTLAVSGCLYDSLCLCVPVCLCVSVCLCVILCLPIPAPRPSSLPKFPYLSVTPGL